MPNRRSFLLLTAALLPAAGGPLRSARAQGAPQRASDFIKGIGDQLVAVVNGPEPDQQKRSKLTQVIDGASTSMAWLGSVLAASGAPPRRSSSRTI